MFSRLRRCSHWPAKFSTSARGARIGEHAAHLRLEHAGLAAAGSLRPASSSSSSGMLLQRKNESRDASSTSLTANDVARRRVCRVSASTRNTNDGLARMRRSASWMPASKPPCRAPVAIERHQPVEVCRRRRAGDTRGARAIDRISRAHRASSSSAASPARQVTKMRRRLGVSPGPVGANGPVIVSVSTCGRPVES